MGRSFPKSLEELALPTGTTQEIQNKIRNQSLTEALVDAGFPEREAWLLELGHREGQLNTVLQQLTDLYDEIEELQTELRGPIWYFLFIMFFASVILFSFMTMFQGLPYGIIYGGGLLGTVFALYIPLRNDFFRLLFGQTGSNLRQFLMYLPYVGKLITNLNLALLYRHWALLHETGAKPSRAFTMLANANYGVNDLDEVAAFFDKGHSPDELPDRLSDQFPSDDWLHILTGFEAGQLTETLDELARTRFRTAKGLMKTLPKILNVVIMIIAGAVVLFVIYQVYTTIIAQALGR